MSRRSTKQGDRATLLRQWAMLMAIPKSPSRLSTREICGRLIEADYAVDIRTVQRDLNQLSAIFCYTCERKDGERTQLWFFPEGARTISIPGMSAETALALLVAKDQSQGLIPPSCLRALQAYFRAADEVLASAAAKGLGAWRQRVCVVRPGPTVRPPEISVEILQAVFDALLQGRQLNVTYKARGKPVVTEQILHPLGLVTKSGLLYLVALTWDFNDPRHYSLHRLQRVTVLDQRARRPEGFDLDAYAKRHFGYPLGTHTLRLKLLMDTVVAQHLIECPLSEDQVSLDQGEKTQIQATVDDTAELRWWLHGYGASVEVLAPARLRREMADTANGLTQMYAR